MLRHAAMARGKDVVRRRCRGKGSLQRRGVSSCVQWKVNGTLPSAVFSISMHSSHWLADKVQRSTDCFFFPEPPGGVVPRGEGGRCQRIGPVSRPSGPKVRGLRDRFCPLSLHPLAARLGIPMEHQACHGSAVDGKIVNRFCAPITSPSPGWL